MIGICRDFATTLCRDRQGAFSATPGLAKRGLGTHQQLLVCSCLSCLRRFCRFRDFRRFREIRPVWQTIGLARADPCSVDFGRETPKLGFEFCCGFFGGFFPPVSFSKENGPKKPPQNSPQNSPEICSERFPSDFYRSLFSACAPLCCKNMCCASRFCIGGGGAVGSRSNEMPKGPESKMLAQGNNRGFETKVEAEAGAP